MYAYVKGVLAEVNPIYVVVEANGIGYTIFIPCSTLGELPLSGNPVRFYTSFVVREFSHALYGFLSARERDVFEILMNISGVGPKLALSLIGHLPGSRLQEAITSEDQKILCTVPGVGKKTAERLIVELRDKARSLPGSSGRGESAQTAAEEESGHARDAVLALINLGYSRANAQKVIQSSIKNLPKDYELSQLLTVALQNIHKM